MSSSPAPSSANLRGILWMTLSMAFFAIEDAFIKTAARQLPLGQILMLFGAVGALVFALWARWQRASLWSASVRTRVMLVRAGFEGVGRLFYALAIVLTPLSSATMILQATPLLVVLGARFFMAEVVSWQRWVSIFAGLVGVLIIIRPSGSDFSALSLLAVIATLGFAGRDLASRAAPAALATAVLGFHGFLTIWFAGFLLALWQGKALLMPSTMSAGALLAAVGCGVLAYTALMNAMRTGAIAVVTPFRYTRILFGLGLGMLVFGETPDAVTLLGCLVIVASGLSMGWRRDRRPSGSG